MPIFRVFTLTGVLVVVGVLSLVWPLPESAQPAGVEASLRVMDRSGYLLREIYPEGRSHPVGLDQVNPTVVEALIAVEDQRFYRHIGVDPFAMLRAAIRNVQAGRVTSGGSTLTMQVARTLRGRTGRSLRDKLIEVHLALRLELRLSKDEILTLWLNRVPFGNRAYGIEAAAQTYFGKGATDLTVGEAALLVGLPQSPSTIDPFRYPERALERRERVFSALQRRGQLSAEAWHDLTTEPVSFVEPRRAFAAPHFVEFIAAHTPEHAVEVRTTLVYDIQHSVESIVRSHLRGLRRNHVTAASVIVLDNRTGEVMAYVGSPDFWDERISGQVDGVRAFRQPGSALKPFLYASALDDSRWTSSSIIPDIELQVLEAGGAFNPENYDRRFHGPVSLRQALGSSLNVPMVRVAQALGPDAMLGTLRDAGFTSLNRSADHYGVGLALGNGEIRLMDLARAYAGLSRGGNLPPVHTSRWTVTSSGDTLVTPNISGEYMGISREAAYVITHILQDDDARTIGFGRGGPLEFPFPVAAKTGTTKDYRDNWAVGYTPGYTVAVWVGNFDGSSMQRVSGTLGAAPILHDVISFLGPRGSFAQPASLEQREVCAASGLIPGAYCHTRRSDLFIPGTTPTDTCTVHRMIELDNRTGLLADVDTPDSARVSELFTVYPPEYHGWMRSQGLRLPPLASAVEESASDLEYTDLLRIDYPADGTIFHIDPILRASYQRVRLRGVADEDMARVQWVVNDEILDSDFDPAYWPLQPGAHTIEIHAFDRTGRRLRSVPARIRVLGSFPDPS